MTLLRLGARPAVFRTLCAIVLMATGCKDSHGHQTVSFASVQAIFDTRCTLCHSGSLAPLGLHLDTLQHALAGSSNGPVIVPHDPQSSELLRRIKGISHDVRSRTGGDRVRT